MLAHEPWLEGDASKGLTQSTKWCAVTVFVAVHGHPCCDSIVLSIFTVRMMSIKGIIPGPGVCKTLT